MTYKDYENDKTGIDENDWWYSASGRPYKPGYEVTEERYDLCDLYNSFSDLDCETVEYEKTDSKDT